MLAFAALLAIFTPLSVHNTRALATNIHENGDCAQFSDLASPVTKDIDGNKIESANVGALVIIFSTFSNPCNYDQEVAIITEVRTKDGTTAFFQSVEVGASAFNGTEVGSLWWPEKAGAYELRSFAVSNFTESEILTDLQTSELLVVDYDSVDYYDFSFHTKTLSAK